MRFPDLNQLSSISQHKINSTSLANLNTEFLRNRVLKRSICHLVRLFTKRPGYLNNSYSRSSYHSADMSTILTEYDLSTCPIRRLRICSCLLKSITTVTIQYSKFQHYTLFTHLPYSCLLQSITTVTIQYSKFQHYALFTHVPRVALICILYTIVSYNA